MSIASLTPREREVLELTAGGPSTGEIAEALGISVRTMEGHLCLIYRKLGVSNRTAASRIWWEHHNGAGG